jgi:hypothetical protein
MFRTVQTNALGTVPDCAPESRLPSRRGTTPSHGRALEILGHAVEYLADSRLYEQFETEFDRTAIRTLMSCSVQVFTEVRANSPSNERARASLLRSEVGRSS